jgi:hypothetical protein
MQSFCIHFCNARDGEARQNKQWPFFTPLHLTALTGFHNFSESGIFIRDWKNVTESNLPPNSTMCSDDFC